jgi:hypothetical protein
MRDDQRILDAIALAIEHVRTQGHPDPVTLVSQALASERDKRLQDDLASRFSGWSAQDLHRATQAVLQAHPTTKGGVSSYGCDHVPTSPILPSQFLPRQLPDSLAACLYVSPELFPPPASFGVHRVEWITQYGTVEVVPEQSLPKGTYLLQTERGFVNGYGMPELTDIEATVYRLDVKPAMQESSTPSTTRHQSETNFTLPDLPVPAPCADSPEGEVENASGESDPVQPISISGIPVVPCDNLPPGVGAVILGQEVSDAVTIERVAAEGAVEDEREPAPRPAPEGCEWVKGPGGKLRLRDKTTRKWVKETK